MFTSQIKIKLLFIITYRHGCLVTAYSRTLYLTQPGPCLLKGMQRYTESLPQLALFFPHFGDKQSRPHRECTVLLVRIT